MKNLRRSLRVLGALSLTGTLLLGGWSAQAAAQPETPSPALAAVEEDWQNTTVIAHCLGQVDGHAGTSSQEAFLESYARGLRVLETDFCLTSDGVLAVRHDFEANSASILGQPDLIGAVTAAQHISTPILGQYQALTAGSLLRLMQGYPEVWVVTDTKETDPELVRREFELLVEAADAVDARASLDRLVIQVYNTEMKEMIEEIYPFEHWIMTVYQLPGDTDYGTLADYCASHGIPVLAVPSTRLTAELAETVHARGLKLYVHTLNTEEEALWALEQGADGIYSDSFTDAQVRLLWAKHKLSLCAELFPSAAVQILERAG